MTTHPLRPTRPNVKGITAAALIVSGWATLLVVLLSTDPANWSWWVVPAVLAQTFLYTGLFITTHDAMHRTVAPDFPRINNAIGQLAVGLYALFSYRKLRTKHRQHHRHPASEHDPDFHDGEHDDTLRWYLRFMVGYLSVGQLVGMAVLFNVLWLVAGVGVGNLLVFWVAPALLSTVQLFYFGTVLPHRTPPEGHDDHHRTTSNDYPPALSFLTCYHFGYHWEHHERPDLPWWALSRYRNQRLRDTGGET